MTIRYPKLRPIELLPAEHRGQPIVVLQDPLQLSGQSFIVHQSIAVTLALLDGEHALPEIPQALQFLTGLEIDSAMLTRLIESLDDCFLLENDRFRAAQAAALEAYYQREARPSLFGGSFPDEPDDLRAWLDSFTPNIGTDPLQEVASIIAPHIDYERGGQLYADVYTAANDAIRSAELIVILGTDHHGPSSTPTFTRQNYSTPFGLAPTAVSAVNELAASAPEVDFFEHELYHLGEHSIELALIWTQYILEGRQVEYLPILAGSVKPYLDGEIESPNDQNNQRLSSAFRKIVKARNTFIIASADLAHIGPAFGGSPVDEAEMQRLSESDMGKIDLLCSVDPSNFLLQIKQEQDRDSICGSAPIFRLLSWSEAKTGHLIGYAQYSADPENTSLVSACGIAYQ